MKIFPQTIMSPNHSSVKVNFYHVELSSKSKLWNSNRKDFFLCYIQLTSYSSNRIWNSSCSFPISSCHFTVFCRILRLNYGLLWKMFPRGSHFCKAYWRFRCRSDFILLLLLPYIILISYLNLRSFFFPCTVFLIILEKFLSLLKKRWKILCKPPDNFEVGWCSDKGVHSEFITCYASYKFTDIKETMRRF